MNAWTRAVLRGPCLGLVMVAFPVLAQAHHSTLPFDGEHPTTIRGAVTGIRLAQSALLHLSGREKRGRRKWSIGPSKPRA